MLSAFLIVVGQVLTLFLMMGVGFVLARQGHFTVETSNHATRVLFYIACPCIVITQLQIDAEPAVIRSMLLTGLGILLTYIVVIALTQIMFRKKPVDTRIVHRFGIVYANSSFMGLPLLAGVLGEEALLFGIVSMLLFSLFQWTHGVLIMGGKTNLRSAILNPGIISIVIGLFLFSTGLRLPAPVYNAMDLLGDLNSPLAMVVIGSQIARADILGILRKPELYLTAALKLIGVPAITALLLLPLNLEPLAYCSCVVLAACPSAGVTSMFSQMFHRDSESGAQIVVLTTLLSIVTLPVFATLARQITGI